MAERALISQTTLVKVEAGDPSVSMGTLMIVYEAFFKLHL
jgi:hypothetical protein